jgi:hypothetical protein
MMASFNNQIIDNVFRGFNTNVITATTGHRISGNVINGVVGGAAVGVFVTGTRNLIDSNQIDGLGGCGITFFLGAFDNAYRDNMLFGNLGGPVCGVVAANIDAGGNIL